MNDPITILLLLSGVACFCLAKSKKRNPWLWLVIGILFSGVALVVLLCLPNGDLEDELYRLKAKVRMLEEARNGEDLPVVKLEKMRVE